MKSKFQIANILSVLVILAILIVPVSTVSFAASPEKAGPPTTTNPEQETEASSTSTGLYIVRLEDAALASYTGGVNGFEATSPIVTGSRYVDVSSAASQSYLAYLEGKHANAIAAMEQSLGRAVEVKYQYLNVLNGMAVAMSDAEAVRVSKLPGILSVTPDTIKYLDTDVSVELIGAPNIWDGNTISAIGTKGEGVIVGVIDSGINHDHPSFAEVGGDGYVHTNPYGTGVYAPGSHCDTDPTFCNDKLIGAWDFNPGGNPEDGDGHGSHTASTSAGNYVTATITVGSDNYDLNLSGVAPHANVIAYKVCNPGCPGSASVASVNQAITDRSNAGGVPMVMNYSISGSDNPWGDSVDLAFLDAFNAGILVSASAGNDGPGASTTAKTGGWNLTVGASTTNRVIANTVDVTGPGTVPVELTGLAAVTGSGPAIVADIENDILWAGDVAPGNETGCSAFPAGTFNDAIALIIRGGCTFATKVDNATAGGAVAVVVFNQFGGPPITMGALEATTIPAVMLDNANGLDVQAWVSANPGATVRINASTSYIQNSDWEDIMGGFSSRGPSQYNTLKPDVTAPGVNVLAAYAVSSEYAFLQGTSMSSPHGAGSAALLMALHPDWSPAEIKSALTMTALTNPAPLDAGTANIYKEDGLTPADWFDMGGGRVDLGAAAFAGLVMDETYTNFVDADPSLGGDPRTLNLHGMQDWECVNTCVFTRTVTSPLTYAVNWDVTVEQPAGVSINVTPNSFSLPAGGSQELVITIDNSGATVAEWQFANVVLTPSITATPAVAPANVAAFDGPLPADAKEEVDGTEAYVSVAAPLANYEAPTAVLYDNGPLVNSPGTGAGGADESMLQNTSLGMGTIGFGHQVLNNNWVADDFVVSDSLGWTIDTATFYSYQTGSPVTSTITSVNWQVWDGIPGASTMITNGSGLLSTGWSNIYRVTETTSGATNRPVYATTVDMGGLNLPAGTYWLSWQTAGSGASGPWAPPITINGQAVTGNGLQSIAGGAYGPALDGGTGTPQQGFPFVLEGTVNIATATYCSTPNLPIPDNNPAGATDSLTIPDLGTILDLDFSVTGIHTWVGDMSVSLTNDGTATTVVAIDRPGYTGTGFGCSANDFNVLLDDEGVSGPVETQCAGTPPALFGNPTPNNPLSAFDTQEMAGSWTLTATDSAGGDTGTVQQWCVDVEYIPGTPSGPTPAPAHLAVAVFNPGSPSIAVTPDEFDVTQGANQIVDYTLTISNTGTGDLEWSIFEDPTQASLLGTWADDFESYVAGSNLHGQGGWKGWFNDPNAGALVSTAQAFNGVNSADINTTSDLVHEYTNTSGQWTYVANVFIPDAFAGDSFFIMMNQYDDAGTNTNWSVQSHFQSATGNLIDDESGNTLPYVTGVWSEIRVLIDLDADQHWFYYNGDLLYTGVWNGYNSGAGTGSDAIANVDLFANGASSVYYDDLALLSGLIPPAGGGNTACDAPADIPWLSVSPTSGVTSGPGADDVTVTLNSTGLTLGVYTGTLCVTSTDASNPLVTVPITMSVSTLPPVIDVAPDALASTQGPDVTTTWDLVISNTGEADLDWAIDEDAIPNVLYATETTPSASGSVTIGDALMSFSPNGSGSGTTASHTLNAPAGLTTITHSATQNITALNSVSCNAGGLHTDNSYLRYFTLADFGITDPFDVTEVSFGVEQATGATGDQPVTVNLYTWNPSDPFIWANFTLIGTADAAVPDQTLSIYTVPVTGTIPAGGTLVVEIFTPDGQTAGNSFFIGSNADGQTAPSYLAAADCGLANPLDTAAIGFPNMMLVMNVTGEIVPAAGVCVNPEDISWASVNPTSGTVAGGTASTVEVTFDSTGLSVGVYTGTLCVTSNDATNPLVTVPLTLTVDENVDVSITKSAPAEAVVGSEFTYTLEVTNAGPATALDTVVEDTLPAGVTFVSASAGCTEAAGVVTCDLGDLASGGSAMIEIVVMADATGSVTNTASVSTASPDTNSANDSDSADTTVVDAPVEEYWIYLPLVGKN
ncbi:MAG: S8 family serine peptidase [Anaerolineales bacterium]|nr:S8 family serine peptidase [Anaerolineales bacterium]